MDNEISDKNALRDVVRLFIYTGQNTTDESQNAVNKYHPLPPFLTVHSFIFCFSFLLLLQCIIIAHSLYYCFEKINKKDDNKYSDPNMYSVTKDTSFTVLGVLLSSGDSLISETESAITNSKHHNILLSIR